MAATNGRTGTPSIKTWIVGLGPAQTDLDALATAGGTQAVSVANTQTTAANLLAALNQVVTGTCP
jgi:hypothetical protein